MLKKEIKLASIVTLSYLLFSCSNNKLKSDAYVSKHFNEYKTIYGIINDSVNRYSDSLLYGFSRTLGESWQIDSMVCINSQKDKLFATINKSNGIGKYGVSDVASELLGKKINSEWYFFKGGGALIIPRDMYGKDEMHPLSFHELSQIARKEMLESALVKKNGEYVVSDEWVDDHFYQIGYGKYDNRAAYDSIHWMLIQRKWQEKIDTNEYKPLRKNKVQHQNI